MADSLKRILHLLVLLAIQILVCNNIHLFGYATPLLIGYFIISIEKSMDRIPLLLWGFACGLIYDIFSNTAGMACSAFTLLAMMRPTILSLLLPRESEEQLTPSVKSMGLFNYINYVFICMFVIHAVFFLLDAFMLSNIRLTLISTISSSLLATVLALFTEMITKTSK